MVMYFKSDKARNYLLKNGFVYTFRRRMKIHLGIENLLINHGDIPFAIANVEFIKNIYDNAENVLNSYYPESGFNTLDEWIKEIIILNKHLPQYGFLYKVTLIKILIKVL